MPSPTTTFMRPASGTGSAFVSTTLVRTQASSASAAPSGALLADQLGLQLLVLDLRPLPRYARHGDRADRAAPERLLHLDPLLQSSNVRDVERLVEVELRHVPGRRTPGSSTECTVRAGRESTCSRTPPFKRHAGRHSFQDAPERRGRLRRPSGCAGSRRGASSPSMDASGSLARASRRDSFSPSTSSETIVLSTEIERKSCSASCASTERCIGLHAHGRRARPGTRPPCLSLRATPLPVPSRFSALNTALSDIVLFP